MTKEALLASAHALVTLCRQNREAEALETLYSHDAVSVEAEPMSGTTIGESVGLAAIQGKHAWWAKTMEVHSSLVEGPFYHGTNRFGVIFTFDASNRQSGERMAMKELAIYTMAEGKIIREEFFYAA